MNLNRVGSSAAAAQNAAVAAASPRLKNAAHEFEASLLAELLKPMRDRSALSGPDDGDDDSSAGASLREYGTEAMAQCLSERGGIGIARMVLAKLAPLEAKEQITPKEGEKIRELL
jgi:Rod binding domain-containing protein